MRCDNCTWFKGTFKGITNRWRGDCRIHAPVRVQERNGDSAGAQDGWPRVDESDFCGEFKQCEPQTSEDRILATIPRLEAQARANEEGGSA